MTLGLGIYGKEEKKASNVKHQRDGKMKEEASDREMQNDRGINSLESQKQSTKKKELEVVERDQLGAGYNETFTMGKFFYENAHNEEQKQTIYNQMYSVYQKRLMLNDKIESSLNPEKPQTLHITSIVNSPDGKLTAETSNVTGSGSNSVKKRNISSTPNSSDLDGKLTAESSNETGSESKNVKKRKIASTLNSSSNKKSKVSTMDVTSNEVESI
jgi:hypothetical protein